MTDRKPTCRAIPEETIEVVARAIFEADQSFERIAGERLPDRHFKVAISLYRAMAQAAITALDNSRGEAQ
jgi:hypothetical protein